MRYFLICLLFGALLPMAAQGQDATIRSGEHADFSRLVLEFESSPDWRIEPRENGYLLTTPGGLRVSGLADVHRFIPRDRIAEVSPTPQGGLWIATAPGTSLEAFLLRGSALVLDVSHGSAETALEVLVDGPIQLLSGSRDGSDQTPARPAAIGDLPEDPLRIPPVLPPLVTFSTERDLHPGFVSNLAEGVARAAAQGLVDATETPPSPQMADEARALEIALEGAPNVRVQTALDRALGTEEDSMARPPPLPTCLPPAYFDVASWISDEPPSVQIARARGGLLGEFDRADETRVTALARLYLALGFGREASMVLSAYEPKVQGTAPLAELARLVDEPGEMRVSFAEQIACESPAALWAALASERLPRDGSFARDAALRAFSGLPGHLRIHLGPRLAELFSAAGDFNGVAHVEGAVALVAAPGSSSLLLIRALGAGHGNGDAVQVPGELAELAQSLRPEAANTLLRLIEDRIEQGDRVPDDLISTAEILGFEQKGTPAGAELRAAGIRARAHNGDAPGAVDELVFALSDGTLPQEEAQPVMSALLRSTARRATDDALLRIVFDPRLGPLLASSDRALRRDLANRMIDLGFSREASRIAPPLPSNGSETEAIYAARLARASGDFQRARNLALALDRPDLVADLAESLSRAGQHGDAAELFEQAQKPADALREAWRAGDWGAVTQSGDPVLSNAARRMIRPSPEADRTLPPSIARFERALGESASLRGDLASLFATLPSPGDGEGM